LWKEIKNTMQNTLPFPDKYKGYICPCCGLFCKVYRRVINSNMGLALLVLYRNREKGFVHLETLLSESGYKRCGDASYLRWYKLIEPLKEKRSDGSQRNGKYKITGFGILFAEGKATVKANFDIFNNNFEGFSGEDVTIHQVLGRKFDYSALMGLKTSETY